MKYFVIDEFGVKRRFPYAPVEVVIIEETGELLEKQYMAGGTIGQNKAVMVSGGQVVVFAPELQGSYGKLLGIAKFAAFQGEPVTVVSTGVMTSPGWGLTPGAIYYVGPAGILTLTPPLTGIILSVGVAVNATTLKLEFSDPIILT